MSAGGNITIPILDRTIATTMSMTKNGMTTTRPIWNAVRSSDRTNAGMAMRSGTSAAVFGRGVVDTS